MSKNKQRLVGQNHCSAGAWEVPGGIELLYILRFMSSLTPHFFCTERLLELGLLCTAATCLPRHLDFLSPLRRAAQGSAGALLGTRRLPQPPGRSQSHLLTRSGGGFHGFGKERDSSSLFLFFFSFSFFLAVRKPYVLADSSARNVVFIKGAFPALPGDSGVPGGGLRWEGRGERTQRRTQPGRLRVEGGEV